MDRSSILRASTISDSAFSGAIPAAEKVMKMATVSLVVPCYNEEEALPAFIEECSRVVDVMGERFGLQFEMVLVNDGSSDSTLDVMRTAPELAPNCVVRWFSLSRNFGKESALLAGLERATGDYVAVLDADMQDPPSLLPEMFEKMQQTNCDCVATRRADRKGEPVVRSALSRAFYRLINSMSDTEFVQGERDFRLMKRQVVDAILLVTENNRFSKGIFSWVGFDTEWVAYENVKRQAGETKWSTRSLFSYALDGITAFSTTPLQISSAASLLLFVMFFIAIIVIVVRRIVFGDPVAGWASTACIILFVGSVQLFCLGVLGNYLAKTYLETKKRPVYIIKESSDD